FGGSCSITPAPAACTWITPPNIPMIWSFTFCEMGTFQLNANFSGGCLGTASIIFNVLPVFDMAVVPSQPMNVLPCNVQNTGNDIRSFTISSMNYKFIVNVWDGHNPGLGWKVNWPMNNSITGSIPLNAVDDAKDPDVCLVWGKFNDPLAPVLPNMYNTVYAIVIYSSLTQGIVWKPFYWDIINQAFLEYPALNALHIQLNTAASGGGNLNIDSDENNNFVMVWTEWITGLSRVNCNSGSAGAGVVPYVNCWNAATGSYINKFIAPDAMMPDVSVFYKSPVEKVRFVYVPRVTCSTCTTPTIQNGLNLVEVNFSSIGSNCLSPSLSTTNIFNTGPNFDRIEWPRIATPNANGTRFQYCIIFEDRDYVLPDAYNYISAYTSSTFSTYNTPYYYTYNDGPVNSPTSSPADIAGINVPHSSPVVTYDNTGNYIYVGWTFDNRTDPHSYSTNLGAYDAMYPLVLLRNINGETAMCRHYWEVPDNLSSGSGIELSMLSVAGRYTAENAYTWFGSDANYIMDIWYKSVLQSTLPALRTEPVATVSEASLNIKPNPVANQLAVGNGQWAISSIEIFDVMAHCVFQLQTSNLKLQTIPVDVSELKPGIYFVIVTDESGNKVMEKIVKM
ncbi:MAG TPA: T9SS type A sorting domain-containing protein, partial [Bacteroidia bacterium]|nr:T9SS type A sorting domain-containing protein [Bacteroidia bacterium]